MHRPGEPKGRVNLLIHGVAGRISGESAVKLGGDCGCVRRRERGCDVTAS